MDSSKRQLLDQKIKQLLLYKKRIQKDSTSSKILQLLYPNKNYTIQQITPKIDKPYFYTKKIVLQLQSNGYLYNDEKQYNRSYHVSQLGRWFAICIILDNISFQSLCILAATYCRVRKDPSNRHTYYLISKFRDDFDKSYDADGICASAVYSSRNITRSIKMLTDRNLVYWINDDFLKTSPIVFEMLQKYDDDLTALVKWYDQMYEKCKDEHLESITLDSNNKKLLVLTTLNLKDPK